MGGRTLALASRFDEANREMITTVERCSDAEWRTRCSGEGWSVGVVAHHVAEAHPQVAGLAKMIATGQALPGFTMDMIDKGNAEHARQYADCTKAETLDLLRKNGAAAATVVRDLGDEQLDRSATVLTGQSPMSVQQVLEDILIGHVREHLGSIRAAVGR